MTETFLTDAKICTNATCHHRSPTESVITDLPTQPTITNLINTCHHRALTKFKNCHQRYSMQPVSDISHTTCHHISPKHFVITDIQHNMSSQISHTICHYISPTKPVITDIPHNLSSQINHISYNM